MPLESFIAAARDLGASDLHLEPGLPPAVRVRGQLRTQGEPIAPSDLLQMCQNLIGPDQWPRFLERRSHDLSKTIQGVRCRINVLQSSRGAGLAIRLLASFQANFEKLNLHPDFKRLLEHQHGLILISGPTGSGKSSTAAAFIEEINVAESRHIVTIESPIEYSFKPRLSYIRQREVGRDTPSFEQALLDALREDPDVLFVGEMREPETMRLTLNASETGHLVVATTHSSTSIEALQRIVSAFPAETQNSVRAQLADCLVAVICQRLRWRSDLNLRVPECEVLVATHPIRHSIRSGEFFKIASIIETGADHGMWTFARYQNWMSSRPAWHVPTAAEKSELEQIDAPPSQPPAPPSTFSTLGHTPREPTPDTDRTPGSAAAREGPIEIEPAEGGLEEVIRKLERGG